MGKTGEDILPWSINNRHHPAGHLRIQEKTQQRGRFMAWYQLYKAGFDIDWQEHVWQFCLPSRESLDKLGIIIPNSGAIFRER